MNDEIIDISGSPNLPGATFFILDNKFMTWLEGLSYLKTNKKLSERKLSTWVCEKKPIIHNYVTKRGEEKNISIYEKWKQKIIDHYKYLTLQ